MSNFQLGSLWPGGIIKYEFDEDLNTDEWPTDKKGLVVEAMIRWMDRTNYSIVFREVNEGLLDMDSVDLYYKDSGEDKDETSTEKTTEELADNVDLETTSGQTTRRFHFNAVHELGHVIGLTHEQSRKDRDVFMSFSQNCINDNYPTGFFDLVGQYDISGVTAGPYNTLSIMHYFDCMACLPNWNTTLSVKNNQLPDILFCPPVMTSFVTPKAFPTAFGTPLTISNQNQLTLWDGAGIIEAYRWKYNKISKFAPVFDSFPNPTMPNKNSEFLQRKRFIIFGGGKRVPSIGAPAVVVTRFKKQEASSLSKCIFLVVVGGSSEVSTTKELGSGQNVFIRKLNGTDGFNKEWIDIGRPNRGALSEPAAISLEDDSIDVFVTDTKGKIFHCLLLNVNDQIRIGKWHVVPGSQTPIIPKLARPAVASNGDGSFSIFHFSDGAIKTARIFASIDKVTLDSNGWVSLTNSDGGIVNITSSPSAVEYSDGKIAVTALGKMVLDGSFPKNESTAAQINRQNVDISNVVLSPNKFKTPYECVWERIGGLSLETYQNVKTKKIGSLFWNSWTHFVGQVNLPGTNPTITSSRDGWKAIYIRGRDGHLLRRWYTEDYGWDPYWWDLGGCMATDPGACEQYIVASIGESREFLNSSVFESLIPPTVQNPIPIQSPADIQDLDLGFWVKIDGPNKKDETSEVEGGGF